jgi:hypothetical protein
MAQTLLALIASFLLVFSAPAAQSPKEAKKARPAWSELSPAQQQILAPLAKDWEQLDSTRRKRWVALADRYPAMSAAEQERFKKRMQEWAQLTPEERALARERYQRLQKLPPKQRKQVQQQLWEEHQETVQTPGPPPGPDEAQ